MPQVNLAITTLSMYSIFTNEVDKQRSNDKLDIFTCECMYICTNKCLNKYSS